MKIVLVIGIVLVFAAAVWFYSYYSTSQQRTTLSAGEPTIIEQLDQHAAGRTVELPVFVSAASGVRDVTFHLGSTAEAPTIAIEDLYSMGLNRFRLEEGQEQYIIKGTWRGQTALSGDAEPKHLLFTNAATDFWSNDTQTTDIIIY